MFTKVTQLGTATIPGSPLIPPNIPTSPNILQIEAERNTPTSILALIETANGANNPNLQSEDLDFVGYTNYTPPSPYIFQQTIGSPSSSAPEALLDGAPIFGLTPGGTLINFMHTNPNLQALVYYVIIRLQDGGDFVEMIVEIDMSLDLPTDIIKNQVAYTKVGAYNGNLSRRWPSILPNNDAYKGSAPPQSLTGFQYIGTVSGSFGQPLCNGNPYTLINTSSGAIQGLLPEQEGYYIYAGGFFNTNLPGSDDNVAELTDFSRESRSLTSYYSIDSSLPLDAPPIILPYDTPNAYNHKIIKDSDPSIYNFAGNTPIQVYTVGTVISKGLKRPSSIPGDNRLCTKLEISIDSGVAPCLGMRPWFGPSDGSLPTAPQASFVNYPIELGNTTEIECIMEDPEILPNGNTQVVFGTNLGADGTLPDFDIGNKIYLFGGVLNWVGQLAPWWDAGASGNPVLGSPWYYSQDLNKVLTMFHYSPWCGLGPISTPQRAGGTTWVDDCPTECTHEAGGQAFSNEPANYLGVGTYVGIDCEIANYSNLNFDII